MAEQPRIRKEANMKIKDIAHTAIIVKNLEEEMIPFLRDFLGLEQLSQPRTPVHDTNNARALGVPGAMVKSSLFEVSPGQFLEVLEYVAPPSPIDRPLPQNAVGSHHVCFTVDDIHEWAERLDAAGYRCFSEPRLISVGIYESTWWMYFEGPGGIVFELMETDEAT
jgi:catechol 2,3-dioxygenase-like lactoylglutathione lyase family enzyme